MFSTLSKEMTSPLTTPLHLPLVFTLASIPVFYVLGLTTGNVSWVDRSWPLFPPLISIMLIGWELVNQAGAIYAHNLPRVLLMFGLQIAWCIRLVSHAAKRNFYDIKSEDYRYAVVRKLIPKWAFGLIHVSVIATAQPLLLFSLCLPLYSALVLPPTQDASTGSLTFKTVANLFPARLGGSVAPTTVILGLSDYFMAAVSLLILYVEYEADRRNYEFQTKKHELIKSLPDKQLVHPKMTSEQQSLIKKEGLPGPSPYPASHHPGFLIKGMWRFSRHPNFAAEQLFWVSQGLFAALAGAKVGMAKENWFMASVFGPCFALSLLFCASTFLTEWISSRKYPTFNDYKWLVGEFLPQETVLLWLWGQATGSRPKSVENVYGSVPSTPHE
nr:hypothetical protein L204_02112 [Cryptococcus depauperatus CBS 7855]